MIRRNTSGFSMVELAMVIAIVAIIGTYLAVDFSNQPDSVRWEQTRAKLEAIRSAILGDDTRNAEGLRSHFGFFGDMGRIPTALTELNTIGSQTAWVYDATVGFGYGWRGPYIDPGASGAIVIGMDEWGTALVYNTSEPLPSIRSYGADRAVSGTGYAKDIIVELPFGLRYGTVRGHVSDKETKLSGKTVQLDYALSGGRGIVSGASTADGAFSFSGIPFGVRNLSVTSNPPLGPKQIVLDRGDFTVSASVLSYGGGTEAVTYVASSANLLGGTSKGYSTLGVVATLMSTYREDQKLKAFTGSWKNGARLRSMTVNGIKETFAAPVASGTKTTLTSSMILPGVSDVNNIELNFDKSMYGAAVTLALEWANSSSVDTVNFTATPAWGMPGTADTSFGTNGRSIINFSGADEGLGLTVQSDGKLVSVGWNATPDVAIARLRADGSLDTTFHSDGMFTIHNSGTDYGRSVSIQSDGKYVIVGGTTMADSDWLMIRLLTDGNLDTTYQTDGKAITNFSGADGIIGGILNNDGNLIGVGYQTGNASDIAIGRYTSDGNLDTTFSLDGKIQQNLSGNDYLAAVALESNGMLMATGVKNHAAGDYVILRYLTNGAADTAFSNDGIQTAAISGVDFGMSIVIDTVGRSVVAGGTNRSGFSGVSVNFGLVRLLSNGLYDTTFNTAGTLHTNLLGDDENLKVILQQDGNIVTGGPTASGTNWNYAIVRYSSNGVLDTAFSNDGIVYADVSGKQSSYSNLSIQPNVGKICYCGTHNADFACSCYWP